MADPIDKINGVLKLKTLAQAVNGVRKVYDNPDADLTQKKAASIAFDKTLKKLSLPTEIRDAQDVDSVIRQYLPLMKNLESLDDHERTQVDHVIEGVSNAVASYVDTGKMVESPAQAFALASTMIPDDVEVGNINISKAAETFSLLLDQGDNFADQVQQELQHLDDAKAKI